MLNEWERMQVWETYVKNEMPVSARDAARS